MNETLLEANGTNRPLASDVIQSGRIAAILGAGLLGLFVVLFVGFAPLAAVHNAVHDVRHSAAFPCH